MNEMTKGLLALLSEIDEHRFTAELHLFFAIGMKSLIDDRPRFHND